MNKKLLQRAGGFIIQAEQTHLSEYFGYVANIGLLLNTGDRYCTIMNSGLTVLQSE